MYNILRFSSHKAAFSRRRIFALQIRRKKHYYRRSAIGGSQHILTPEGSPIDRIRTARLTVVAPLFSLRLLLQEPIKRDDLRNAVTTQKGGELWPHCDSPMRALSIAKDETGC